MTLPSTAYRGHAAPTWDTKTIQQVIDYLTSSFTTPALDARYDARYAPINRDARGIQSWIRGFPAVATTSEAQCFYTVADVVGGRIYECALLNITPDQGNTKATEFRMRYATGTGNPVVTNSSAIMAISLRLSQFELATVRTLYVPGASTRLGLRASISSLDGLNVRSWCPGDGGILMINDLGAAPAQVGSAP